MVGNAGQIYKAIWSSGAPQKNDKNLSSSQQQNKPELEARERMNLPGSAR
jgi:hypothetical protein